MIIFYSHSHNRTVCSICADSKHHKVSNTASDIHKVKSPLVLLATFIKIMLLFCFTLCLTVFTNWILPLKVLPIRRILPVLSRMKTAPSMFSVHFVMIYCNITAPFGAIHHLTNDINPSVCTGMPDQSFGWVPCVPVQTQQYRCQPLRQQLPAPAASALMDCCSSSGNINTHKLNVCLDLGFAVCYRRVMQLQCRMNTLSISMRMTLYEIRAEPWKLLSLMNSTVLIYTLFLECAGLVICCLEFKGNARNLVFQCWASISAGWSDCSRHCVAPCVAGHWKAACWGITTGIWQSHF